MPNAVVIIYTNTLASCASFIQKYFTRIVCSEHSHEISVNTVPSYISVYKYKYFCVVTANVMTFMSLQCMSWTRNIFQKVENRFMKNKKKKTVVVTNNAAAER